MGRKKDLAVFVLCGGKGTRLWPISTAKRPKPFHAIVGDKTLLSVTLERAKALTDPQNVFLIGNADHAQMLLQHCADAEIRFSNCILEPDSLNTGFSVAVATAIAARNNFTDICVLPSDHHIEDVEAFSRNVRGASKHVRDFSLILFGIDPSRPDTGFGYVEHGKPDATGVLPVIKFHEKPNQPTADAYFKSDGYAWNTGIFLFQTKEMNSSLRKLAPVLWDAASDAIPKSKAVCQQTQNHNLKENAPIELAIATLRPEVQQSFDVAIVEQLNNIAMIKADFRWQDLGTWRSIFERSTRDAFDNALTGQVTAKDTRRVLIDTDHQKITAVGIKDLAVVSRGDELLITSIGEHGYFSSKPNVQTGFFENADAFQKHSHPISIHTLINWIDQTVIPKWAEHSLDKTAGVFHDTLEADFKQKTTNYRLRTHARLTHTWGRIAFEEFHQDARKLAEVGLSLLTQYVANGDGVHTSPPPLVTTDCINLFDLSCMLLAAASCQRIGLKGALELGNYIMNQLREHHRSHHRQVFVERPSEELEEIYANTQMHLHEAFLHWYQATGSLRAARYAEEIVQIFLSDLFDHRQWIVHEKLLVSRGAIDKRSSWWEPGHSHEWRWRLHAHEMLLRHIPEIQDHGISRKLHLVATSFGEDDETGLCYTKLSPDHGLLDANTRSWQQIEAIRASVIGGAKMSRSRAATEKRIQLFWENHVVGAPAGGWTDSAVMQVKKKHTPMPASTLYHLMGLRSVLAKRSKS